MFTVDGYRTTKHRRVGMDGMVGGKKGKKKVPMQLKVNETPESMDPSKVVNFDDIPGLFRSIERMMRGLRDLNAEFCMQGDRIGEIWLVPAYTDEDRNEISFEDAAKIVVVCGSFGATVEEMRFVDRKGLRTKLEGVGLEEDGPAEEVVKKVCSE